MLVLLSTAHAIEKGEAAARVASSNKVLFMASSARDLHACNSNARNCAWDYTQMAEIRKIQRLDPDGVQKTGQIIV
jgi:hypothetical protein